VDLYDTLCPEKKLKVREMRKKKLSRKEATQLNREKIITEAMRLFLSQGYNETTMKQISDATELSIGSIYHLFEGKDAILKEYSFSLMDDSVFSSLENTEENLRNVCSSLVEVSCRIARILDTLGWEMSNLIIDYYSADWIDMHRDFYERAHPRDQVEQFLRAAQEYGSLTKNVPVGDILELLKVVAVGTVHRWIKTKGSYSLESKIRYYVTFIVNIFTV